MCVVFFHRLAVEAAVAVVVVVEFKINSVRGYNNVNTHTHTHARISSSCTTTLSVDRSSTHTTGTTRIDSILFWSENKTRASPSSILAARGVRVHCGALRNRTRLPEEPPPFGSGCKITFLSALYEQCGHLYCFPVLAHFADGSADGGRLSDCSLVCCCCCCCSMMDSGSGGGVGSSPPASTIIRGVAVLASSDSESAIGKKKKISKKYKSIDCIEKKVPKTRSLTFFHPPRTVIRLMGVQCAQRTEPYATGIAYEYLYGCG